VVTSTSEPTKATYGVVTVASPALRAPAGLGNREKDQLGVIEGRFASWSGIACPADRKRRRTSRGRSRQTVR